MTAADTNTTFTADELQSPGGRARLASAVRLANLDGRMYPAPDCEHTSAALEQLATEGVLVAVKDTGYVAVPGDAFNALIDASDEDEEEPEAPEQNTAWPTPADNLAALAKVRAALQALADAANAEGRVVEETAINLFMGLQLEEAEGDWEYEQEREAAEGLSDEAIQAVQIAAARVGNQEVVLDCCTALGWHGMPDDSVEEECAARREVVGARRRILDLIHGAEALRSEGDSEAGDAAN